MDKSVTITTRGSRQDLTAEAEQYAELQALMGRLKRNVADTRAKWSKLQSLIILLQSLQTQVGAPATHPMARTDARAVQLLLLA